jgi:hypothetical protein
VQAEPVSTTEIAERLGVTVHAVRRWRTRQLGFPEPWVVLAVGPIWRWSHVELWALETGRL